jgi:hypothetical protein
MELGKVTYILGPSASFCSSQERLAIYCILKANGTNHAMHSLVLVFDNT